MIILTQELQKNCLKQVELHVDAEVVAEEKASSLLKESKLSRYLFHF